MKYISICSGIEAASVAWEGFGWTPLAFSEIEAFPSTVLAHHYPGVPNLGDMTKFEDWPEEILAQCDILVGGPPCQAFSVAGLRKSLQDERGNVTLAYVRLLNHIDEVRRRHGRPPVIAVYENVPGLLSTKDNAFGCLVGALCGCDEAPETETGKWPKAGFLCGEARRVGYRVLDAQFFGVAQRRRRIFLIAVPCELVERLGERACPSEILSLRESMRGNPPTRGAKGEGVTRDASPCIGAQGKGGVFGSGRDSQDTFVTQPVAFHHTQDPISSEDGSGHAIGTGSSGGCATAAVAFTKSKRAQSATDDESWVPGEVAPTFNCFDQGDTRATTVVAFTTEQTPKFKDDCALTMTKQSPSGGGQPQCVMHPIAFTQNTRDEVRQINGDGQLAGALSAEAGMHQTNYVAFAQNQPGEVRTNSDVMGTVNTNQNASGRNTPMVQQAMSVRRLTPQECERLQGFPDGYTAIEYRKKPAADGPRYKALGNSMAVPCMWWIGMRIAKATEQE